MATNQQKYKTNAVAQVSDLVVRATPGRKKLILCNPNAAAILEFSLNNPLPYGSGFPLQPNEKYVADWITENDAVYITSDTADAILIFAEIR